MTVNDLTIVMYHYVRDVKESKYPKINGLEVSGFIRQLDHLADNFNIVKAEDVINCVKHGSKLPVNSCLLTFRQDTNNSPTLFSETNVRTKNESKK